MCHSYHFLFGQNNFSIYYWIYFHSHFLQCTEFILLKSTMVTSFLWSINFID